MKALVTTEWLKMRKYNAFWWIMGLTLLSYPGINYIFYIMYQELLNQPSDAAQLAKMAIGNPYAFPDVWHTVAFATSLFTFIPAVVVIMFITNEYSFRTHRQNIIDGWSRSQFVTSKLVDVLIITLLLTGLYLATVLIAGAASHTRLIRDTWGSAYFAALFFLQTFAQLSMAFMIGFLVRKAFIALGAFLFLFIILDNLLTGLSKYFKADWGKYMPLEITDKLIPVPAFIGRIDPAGHKKAMEEIPLFCVLTILLTLVIWLICYRVNNRKDLK
jgi:ABC-2 type transport system permease protein